MKKIGLPDDLFLDAVIVAFDLVNHLNELERIGFVYEISELLFSFLPIRLNESDQGEWI